MRKVIILMLSLFWASGLLAQDNPLKKALEFYQSGKLDEARSMIVKSSTDEQWREDPNTWYLMGFIMKDLYKRTPEADSALFFRLTSLDAFKHLIEAENAAKYLPDALKSIKYLSSTFYNDAIGKVEKKEFEEAKAYFERFKNALILSRDTSTDLKEQETGFLLALGTTYMEVYKNDSTKNKVNLDGARKAYESILSIDPTHVKANYNMGVLYYNEAVNLITRLDYDEVDLIAISQIEDQSIELFKQSLPFMEFAYKQNPNDKNTLEGLAGIYFSLRDYDKSKEYKDKLAVLENEE